MHWKGVRKVFSVVTVVTFVFGNTVYGAVEFKLRVPLTSSEQVEDSDRLGAKELKTLLMSPEVRESKIARLTEQIKVAEDNGLWLIAYRRLGELEGLESGRKDIKKRKQEVLKKLNNSDISSLGKLALNKGILVSHDGTSKEVIVKLPDMIRKDGGMNVTTNAPLLLANLPAFEKEIKESVREKKDVEEIFNKVFVAGLVRETGKMLRDVVRGGEPGGVSIEIRSHLDDPREMLAEAKLLADLVGVEDTVMNKIPAVGKIDKDGEFKGPGITTIRDAVRDGLYPNVTLVFCSHKQIKAVAKAIAEGLKLRVEKLRKEGEEETEVIDEMLKFKSFISYFVSRVTSELVKSPNVTNRIKNANKKGDKLELLHLVMDAAVAFYIDAHEKFLLELRKAGFSEVEKLGASPTIELDASTGEKAVKQDSAFVKALTEGDGAIPIDELAKYILIDGIEGYNSNGFYVFKMARPGSMNTIPIKTYKTIVEGKGAGNIEAMTISEARGTLKSVEREFEITDDVWEKIAEGLLSIGVKSFIEAEQDLRIGILKIVVDEAIKQGNYEYALEQVDSVIIPGVTSNDQMGEINKERVRIIAYMSGFGATGKVIDGPAIRGIDTGI